MSFSDQGPCFYRKKINKHIKFLSEFYKITVYDCIIHFRVFFVGLNVI